MTIVVVTGGSSINSVRRYYLLQRHRARLELSPTEPAWQAKQEEEPATALPDAFPMRIELAGGGYTTYADLNGADEMELRIYAGLTPHQAQAVMNELAATGNPDAQ